MNMTTIVTYQVSKENFNEFLRLMKECEIVMRREDLISSKPIYRMQSVANEELLIEIFEWKNEDSFQDAQKNMSVLELWKQYESNWIRGGFGLNKIPESTIPWAQFKSIN